MNHTKGTPTKRAQSKAEELTRRFIQEYAVDFNLTRATVAAGITQVDARALLKQNHVRTALRGYRRDLDREVYITRGFLEERALEAFHAAMEPDDSGRRQVGAAVGALALLAKMNGMLIDRKRLDVVGRMSSNEIEQEAERIIEKRKKERELGLKVAH